ncbi:MAG: hypothetical protein K2J88_04900, partial [Oscillospiraceae bacterium]|nr:hypothetical protein [Oscillospiraceae bacterium]
MKKKAFFCSMILAISMGIPLTAHAEQNFQISEKPVFQQDENGNQLYFYEDKPVVGKFSITPDYLAGDLDSDGKINASDAAYILYASAEAGANGRTAEEILLELFSEQKTIEQVILFADVNYDNIINTEDATAILSYASMLGSGINMHPLGYTSYYADENGILLTGWIQDAETGNHYYAQENYQFVTGWLNLEDNYYYFNSDGILLTGLQEISDKKYNFDENGIMLTGWQILDNINYYFNDDGSMHTGWLTENENIYYFDKDGSLVTGWQEIYHKKYYFDENGIMLTGWQMLDDINYYFNTEGSVSRSYQIDNLNT